MLPIGRLSQNGTCHGPQDRMTQFTVPEQYSLMTLWGIFKSPLMIGCNLPDNDDFTLSLLTNAEYMNMNQNSYGAKQIFRDEKNGKGTVIWSANGKKCKYLAVFNTDTKMRKIKVNLTDILMADTKYSAYDIWSGDILGEYKNNLTVEVEPHGARLIKLS
jgi:hypothetical protein